MSDDQGADLRCERVRLLLSLAIDEAATPAQQAEIDAHVPGCAECRAALASDRAVRARCTQSADVPDGFAARVVAAVAQQRLATRAENRFLFAAAAAAVLVAGVALAAFGPPTRRSTAPDMTAATAAKNAVRDTAGRALRAGLARGRNPSGRTPPGVEDR